jgi:hypothetical protein
MGFLMAEVESRMVAIAVERRGVGALVREVRVRSAVSEFR